LGAMPTLVVGMFSRENRHMATRAWPCHRYTDDGTALVAFLQVRIAARKGLLVKQLRRRVFIAVAGRL
jgi:hypothetical protein